MSASADPRRVIETDVAAIGAGQASVPSVKAAAASGRSAVLVKRRDLGGSCANFGCTPSEAALASAQRASDARADASVNLYCGDRVVWGTGCDLPEPFYDLAQRYERPIGHFALFPAKVTCCLDGVRATSQEGGYYGGWITPSLMEPFEGAERIRDW